LSATLGIDRRLDGIDLCRNGPLWLGSDGQASGEIGQSKESALRALDFDRKCNVGWTINEALDVISAVLHQSSETRGPLPMWSAWTSTPVEGALSPRRPARLAD
jgi:hypothetical protein